MITTVYITASNGGDGSAILSVYEDIDVVDWIEEYRNDGEGFAEPSVMSLAIEHDSPISIPKVISAFDYYLDLVKDENKNAAKFREEFIDKFPEEYTLENGNPFEKYKDINVLVDGKIVKRLFVSKSVTLEKMRKRIENPKNRATIA